VCSHCSGGFCLGTTRAKEARGGGGARDGWRGGRGGRDGDGNFGPRPTFDGPVGATSGGEEGGAVKIREEEEEEEEEEEG
jgi:hypothetical protein